MVNLDDFRNIQLTLIVTIKYLENSLVPHFSVLVLNKVILLGGTYQKRFKQVKEVNYV